jgi:glutamate-ammonia-ligase adenylyltransferase
MTFWARITRHPIAYDPDRAADVLTQVPDLPKEMRALIGGTAGCSPYLARLIVHEQTWLLPVLDQDPEAAFADLLAQIETLDLGALSKGLRQVKRRAALLIALADLGGVWDQSEVTGALSDLADHAVHKAQSVLLMREAARGKLPGFDEEKAANGAGFVVLAMGKLGARELNYSSDIDLICFYDDAQFEADDQAQARATYVAVTRKLRAVLSDPTSDGYVFRTDLRLRPDASVTPVCVSLTAAERYYEAEGRSWERAAFIKARPAAADIAAGERFLRNLQPFVWRRHLDYAAIQDVQDLRLRIKAHKGFHGPITPEGHNIKLGAGGIREIEFFAQTRQLIAGGRDPSLRARRTDDALRALVQKDWVPEATAERLITQYRAHRETEHRLQMIHDTQTHSLPTSEDGMDRLARFSGWDDTAAFRADLQARLVNVDHLTEPFFAPTQSVQAMPELSKTAHDIVDRWTSYPALRSQRGRSLFEQLRPELLTRFQTAARPDEALRNFDRFLHGLPAGVQLFSMFQANPSLIDLLVDICATAPGLARYLSRNSGVLEAVIGGQFFTPWPKATELAAELGQAIAGLDYEAQLDAARRWHKDWHFRIGVHHLRGLISAETAGAQYSRLADTLVAGLWPLAQAQITHRHGPAPGVGGVVVAMGSLGAGRLTATSDLDLIVIYDAAGQEMSDGPRPLEARGWYAKSTKALVTALSAPTAEGKLYDVDMRLRPSGRQGPVATGLEAFQTYQRQEAWTWEHLALTRARMVAGPAILQDQLEQLRQDILMHAGAPETVLKDVSEMRVRLQAAGRVGDLYAAKDGAGRMQDIELLAQAAALIAGDPSRDVDGQLAAGVAIGWLTPDQVDVLGRAHLMFSRLQHAQRLLTDRDFDIDEIGRGGQSLLARALDVADVPALAAKLESMRSRSEAIIELALQNRPNRLGKATK